MHENNWIIFIFFLWFRLNSYCSLIDFTGTSGDFNSFSPETIFIRCKVIHALLQHNNIYVRYIIIKRVYNLFFSFIFFLLWPTYFAIRNKLQIYSLNGLKRRRDRNLKDRPRLKVDKNRRARFLWLHGRRHPGWRSRSRLIDHQRHF